jgi:hypothetical protein
LSDILRKKNVQTVQNAVEIVNQLRGVKFTWNDSEAKSFGVIAQEIEQVMPELVELNELLNAKTVNYSGIIAVLIESIKELSARVEELEQKSRGK